MAFDPSTAQLQGFDPSTAKPLDAPNPEMTQTAFEGAHPFMAAAEHVADIPFRAANSALLGWPKYALEKAGGTIPPEPDQASKVLGTVADIGGFAFNPLNKFLPMTSLGNAAKQGVAAVGMWAPEKGQSTQDLVSSKAVNAPLAAMTPGLIHGATESFMGIPQGMRDMSARMNDLIVKLPKKAFNYSKDPMAVFNKENIIANTTQGYAKAAEERLSQRVSELNQKVANNKSTVDLSGAVNDEIDSRLADVAKSTNKSLRDTKTQELNDLKTELNGRGLENMSVQDAVDLKRQLAKDYPFSYTEPRTSTANTLPATVHTIHHEINSAIDKVAPEVSDLNQRVSGLIDISQAARNRAIVESRNDMIGPFGKFASLASGAAGGAHGGAGEGLIAAAGVPLTMKALSSPAVLTRVAAALSKMSDIDKVSVFKSYPWLKDKIGGTPGGTPTKITPEIKVQAKDQVNKGWYEGMFGQRFPDTSKKAVIGGTVTLGAGALANDANAMGIVPKHKEGDVLNGEASTYGWGEKLNPNRFDNKPFKANDAFVAMRNVPMGTTVRITDQKTGKSIETTVQDGGPAQKTKRVVDLSQGAWRKLGYSKAGLTDVKVEIVKLGKGHSYPRNRK